jgi:ATP-dependent DNA helicase RecQ
MGNVHRDALLGHLRALSGGRIEEFQPGQCEAIRAVVEDGGRTLLVQPTGWGKSLVYFAATMVLRRFGAGPTLLISPLLALMRDQLRAAVELGLRAATINSENQPEWPGLLAALADDAVDILLVSPEKLADDVFVERHLARLLADVKLFVVDEAHCISDWGHDFRPDYQRIRRLLADRLPAAVAVLATTATANRRVVADVCDQIGAGTRLLRGSLARPSLCLQVVRLPSRAQRFAWLAEHLAELPGSGLVYASTRHEVDLLADWLRAGGVTAAAYHAGLDNDRLRRERESDLHDNRLKAVVATTALGMGFDKPDLGFVVHHQTPPSAVHYYQQVGRAGRAIEQAYGILLGGHEDDGINRHFIDDAYPEESDIRAVLDLIEDSETGLAMDDISRGAGLAKAKAERIVRLLAVGPEPPVERHAGRWVPTLQPYLADHGRVAERARLRLDEWQRMRAYRKSRRCLMEFLLRELDDPTAAACGRCANCLARPLVSARVARRTVRRAADFLAARGIREAPAPLPDWWSRLRTLFDHRSVAVRRRLWQGSTDETQRL